MPINPGKKESEDEFISRCMSIETEDYDQSQAYAICKSKWDKDNMSFQKITCDECGWSWDLKDGGDDPYVCHKCGNKMPKPVSDEAQQGGVVSPGSFARTKFEYPPIAKEKLNDFMGRCMSDSVVREKKKERMNRAGFCYSQYQSRYIANIGKGWR